MIAAIMPRIVTTANNSIKEKADRLLFVRIMIVFQLCRMYSVEL